MRFTLTLLPLAVFTLLGIPSLHAQQQSTPPAPQAGQAPETGTGRSPGGDVGSGAGDIGKGTGKGAGKIAEGTGKGAVDVVTLHPVSGAESVGKGAAVGGKDIGVGAVKGTGKMAKGAGRGIGKGVKKIF
ncbi:MAG: hypothetical protein PW735_03820 [Acidobacteriaceae bacterium]|nr:hypothetical protein [Acidobacteriaceae bacterium]